jgi:aminopeptidase Y
MSPPPAGPIANQIMSYSGSGDVTASVTALIPPPADSTPGCEAADYAGFPAGNIALISRGACTFALKATNAYSAGASGVVIYNSSPGLVGGTLGNSFTLDIPVTSISQSDGQTLAATAGLILRLMTDTLRGPTTSYNVIAETPTGDPNNVIMVGAHLDSVNGGPGIQDNGSGSAAILETALQMARARPHNKVRFAWWGASENGLVGSDYYVFGLTEEEKASIALYLNFDQIGSPNYVRFIYDGDGSAFGLAGPEGSASIEAYFQGFYAARGLEFEATQISFRSDYSAFFDSGIPFGGLFTGAEVIKTPEQAAIYGGTAGDQYDPCYHLACDTFDNISLQVLDLNSDAAASAILHYSNMSMGMPRPLPPICESP